MGIFYISVFREELALDARWVLKAHQLCWSNSVYQLDLFWVPDFLLIPNFPFHLMFLSAPLPPVAPLASWLTVFALVQDQNISCFHAWWVWCTHSFKWPNLPGLLRLSMCLKKFIFNNNFALTFIIILQFICYWIRLVRKVIFVILSYLQKYRLHLKYYLQLLMEQ